MNYAGFPPEDHIVADYSLLHYIHVIIIELDTMYIYRDLQYILIQQYIDTLIEYHSMSYVI